MTMQLRKLAPVELRTLGLDERWLQEGIIEDPSILGLGELEIAAREHRQPIGGRIDFLMRDSEAETYYEVEIMLGALDESHIIRTLEYWDIERQRRPHFDHRAVIVAEQITGRFFNVIRLRQPITVESTGRAAPTLALCWSRQRGQSRPNPGRYEHSSTGSKSAAAARLQLSRPHASWPF